MKSLNLLILATVIGFAGTAMADSGCHSVAVVNGVKYESDKCNVSVVNGVATFSDTPATLPQIQIPQFQLPQGQNAQAQLPSSISSYLTKLLASLGH